MGDIDFDELDRAVSSLMEKTTQREDDPGQEMSPAQDSDDAIISPSDKDNSPSISSNEPSAPVPIVARRSSGRFMDVIPSSNRPSQPRQAPSEAVRRESATVENQNFSLDDDSLLSDTSVDISAELGNDVQESSEPNELSATNNPLDPYSAPQNSPFLEGVEIDKRPLGSSTIDTEVTQEDAVNQDLTMPDPIDFDQQQSETPESSTSGDTWSSEAEPDELVNQDPVKPEFSPEMLAVESMVSDESESLESSGTNKDVEQAQPVAETLDVTEVRSVSEAVRSQPVVSGDIAQQYSPSGDATPEPSAVFDAASEVPATLSHPAKKKSGWSIVLWILLMIIIGVGGGVAVWYFLVR